jgi:chromosome segregation ATPase
MRSERSLAVLIIVLGVVLTSGCVEETTELKGKISMLEKRLLNQEKKLREFSGKFLPPKDFSPDIQRIADQQDRINQILKTKVDPINSKLEEFRDWAQQTQNEQSKAAGKRRDLIKTLAELHKKIAGHTQEVRKLSKQVAMNTLRSKRNEKAAKNVSTEVKQIRGELVGNDTKLFKLIKKNRIVVRDDVLAKFKALMAPLEKEVADLRTGLQANRTGLTVSTAKAQDQSARQIKALYNRLRELEEIIAVQKASLLEVGSKIHKLEQKL